MNISGKNLPEIRWHRAVFFTEVGIRRDVATNTHSPLVSFYTASLYRLITGETSSAPPPPRLFLQDIAATDNIYFEKWPAHASRPYNKRTKREKNSLLSPWRRERERKTRGKNFQLYLQLYLFPRYLRRNNIVTHFHLDKNCIHQSP